MASKPDPKIQAELEAAEITLKQIQKNLVAAEGKKEQDLKATSGDLEWTKELDKDIQAIHGQIDKFKKEIQDTEKGSKGKKNKKPQRR